MDKLKTIGRAKKIEKSISQIREEKLAEICADCCNTGKMYCTEGFYGSCIYCARGDAYEKKHGEELDEEQPIISERTLRFFAGV